MSVNKILRNNSHLLANEKCQKQRLIQSQGINKGYEQIHPKSFLSGAIILYYPSENIQKCKSLYNIEF